MQVRIQRLVGHIN
ncbi:hypothetical protein Pint_23241 [Pistacia integerrima]|uniref:Uncharacterized protein n=1 Tax=Pistacia integerrima TaxID=434235 RepID=A0ACC0YNG8_9ROSI|nr:hypothetical protein Pint_23241 [Pistacia integerrima]